MGYRWARGLDRKRCKVLESRQERTPLNKEHLRTCLLTLRLRPVIHQQLKTYPLERRAGQCDYWQPIVKQG